MTDRFIHRQNIQRFRHLLAEAKDGQVRDTIQQLLNEELAKDNPQQQADGGRPPSPPR
jgi:hypothetical protein